MEDFGRRFGVVVDMRLVDAILVMLRASKGDFSAVANDGVWSLGFRFPCPLVRSKSAASWRSFLGSGNVRGSRRCEPSSRDLVV